MIGMKKDKEGLFEGKMPKKGIKVTMMADSKESIMEAAEKLPEMLSKAEQIKRAKFGSKKEESEEESACKECDKSPCEC